MLEYADPPTRHALRAACRQLYLLPAVGSVRVPVQNPFALELCERAAGSTVTVTVPFWGCTASRVTLVHDRASDGPRCYQTQAARFCRSLAALLGEHAPTTVEFRFIEGNFSSNDCPRRAMEALVEAPYWTAAELELRDTRPLYLRCLMEARCSEALKARLVWCDLRITDWLSETGDIKLFPALRNLAAGTELSAAVFPALEHVATGNANARPETAPRWLASLGGQLRSVEWTLYYMSWGPLQLAHQTQIQCTGSLGCLIGGQVESARLVGTETHHKRCFDAVESLEIFFHEHTGTERFIELNAPQSLPCRRLSLIDVPERTAVLLLGRACSLHTLTLTPSLLTPAVIATLPPTLRVLSVCVESGLPEHLEQLMRLPGLLRLGFEAIYFADQLVVSTKVREFRAANPGLRMPAVSLKCYSGWRLRGTAPAPGVNIDRVWIDETSFADADSADATLALMTGPECEWDWTRGVCALDIKMPLGPGFWRAAPRLAGVFPCVARIWVSSSPSPQEMDALRTLCLGIGPALRIFVGIKFARTYLFLTDELEQNCPWLTVCEV